MGKIFSCLFPQRSQKYRKSQPLNYLHEGTIEPIKVVQNSLSIQERNQAQLIQQPENVTIIHSIIQPQVPTPKIVSSSQSEDEIESLNDEGNQNYKQIQWVEGELIGQGSFGLVKMGMNSETGQMMAVKQVFLKNLSKQAVADKVVALELEIYFLSRLKHENIVQYLGMEKTKDTVNIFLEFISGMINYSIFQSGGSLQSQLGKFGKFKETLIKVYVRQILQGLNYLHSKKVIHRDIKGANILVDNYGVIRLADFGSSKKLNEIVNTENYGSLCGTPNFMAPEVVNQQKYGRKADIWSLGCTIIEMATGKPPWSEYNNPIAVMIRIAKADRSPELPSYLSQEAKSFLEVCLKVNPSERWSVRKLISHPFLLKQQHSARTKYTTLKPNQKNPKLEDTTPSKLAPVVRGHHQTNVKQPNSVNDLDQQFAIIDVNQGLSPKLKKKKLQDAKNNYEIVDNIYPDKQQSEEFYKYDLSQTNVIQVIRKQTVQHEKDFMIEILPNNGEDDEMYFSTPALQIQQNIVIPKVFLEMMVSNPQDDISPRSKDQMTLERRLDDILNSHYQGVGEGNLEKQSMDNSPSLISEEKFFQEVVVEDGNLDDQLGKIIDNHYKSSPPAILAQQFGSVSPREQQILQENTSLEELLLKHQLQQAQDDRDKSSKEI